MKIYFVVTDEKDGKRYSYVESLSYGYNVISFLTRLTANVKTVLKTNVESVIPFKTKKEAEKIAEAWNNTQRKSGTLLYS